MKGITVLLVLALLMSASAFAETIYLQCAYKPDKSQTINLTVDPDAKTVDNKPATISTTAIDWQLEVSVDGSTHGETATIYNHIDRVTGTFSTRATFHFRNGDRTNPPSTYDCTPASAPKTKF